MKSLIETYLCENILTIRKTYDKEKEIKSRLATNIRKVQMLVRDMEKGYLPISD